MVAHERIKRAETQEELREARMEKEALKSALRVVEGENGRLRRGNLIYPIVAPVRKGDEFGDDQRQHAEIGGEEGARVARGAVDLMDVDEDREKKVGELATRNETREETAADAEAEAGPSASRSSSRIGLKSPATSRRSSVSASERAPVFVTSSPLPVESHSISTPILPHPLLRPPSPSVTSSSMEEYTTPQSQSCSQSHSQSDIDPDIDQDRVPDPSSHTPTSIPAPDPIATA